VILFVTIYAFGIVFTMSTLGERCYEDATRAKNICIYFGSLGQSSLSVAMAIVMINARRWLYLIVTVFI